MNGVDLSLSGLIWIFSLLLLGGRKEKERDKRKGMKGRRVKEGKEVEGGRRGRRREKEGEGVEGGRRSEKRVGGRTMERVSLTYHCQWHNS